MRFLLSISAVAVVTATAMLACSSQSSSESDAGTFLPLGDSSSYVDASDKDGSKPKVDGGFVSPGGTVLREDRFVTNVVSFTPGPCAGFGAGEMPGIVQGPPVGTGVKQGGLDVVTLGIGGEIVLAFGDNAIVDQPGPDFIVFENAFYIAGSTTPNADLGEVSVSEDGITWKTFPCNPGPKEPYPGCAGWTPVYSAPDNDISPVDVAKAGGEAFDLADVGLATAKLVRIKDRSTMTCSGPPSPINLGFDLDAIAIVHAKIP